MKQKVLLLGVGGTARALVDFYKQGTGCKIVGTTRSAAKTSDADGLSMILENHTEAAARQIEEAAAEAFVLVSYPPEKDDIETLESSADRRYGPLVARARKIVYISSTGVYDGVTGDIDEQTQLLEHPSLTAAKRLASESFWLGRGAIVLRAPGLYGPGNGLHQRLLNGSYKLPGDGQNFVSRIHLDDLARLIDAAFRRGEPGKLYLVGDEKPATHKEVVSWLCDRLNLPLPASAPLDMVPPTLRGNRRVNAALVRKELDVQLRFPSYVEGFSDCLARL